MTRQTLRPLLCATLAFVGAAGCKGAGGGGRPAAAATRPASNAVDALSPDKMSDYGIALARRLARPAGAATADAEVFAIERRSTWGGSPEITEIAVDAAGRGRLTVRNDERADRCFTRDVTAAEIAGLRALAARADPLPALEDQAWDGVNYNFAHGTAGGPLRVLTMNNPPVPDDASKASFGPKGPVDPLYGQVVLMMRKLADPDKLTPTYDLRRPIAGMTVAFAHPDRLVRNFWAKGDDVRVNVAKDGYIDEPEWYRVHGGKLAEAVAPPDSHRDDAALANEKAPGGVQGPVLADDGRLGVGTLKDKLVRFDVADRRVIPIADDAGALAGFQALRRVATTGKIMIVRHHVSPLGQVGQGTLRLIDPATGASEEVHPDFQVWIQPMRRPYQPTRQDPSIVWVAFSGAGSGYTMVGRYDLKKLEFRQWVRVESIKFQSDGMWVDEEAGYVYANDDGQLLRLPLDREVYTEMERGR